MKLLVQILLICGCLSASAQSERQTLFFDKCGDLATAEKFKRKRALEHTDSLIIITEFNRKGRRIMTAEFKYSADLMNSLEQHYSNYHDHRDLMGIRNWYHHNDSIWKVEILAPFEFDHQYRTNVATNCSTVDSKLYSNSTYKLELRKNGTLYREGLYVHGDSFDGKMQGLWTYYNKKEEIFGTYEYELSQKHGTQTLFQNGRKISSREFVKDQKIGKPTYFDHLGNPL